MPDWSIELSAPSKCSTSHIRRCSTLPPIGKFSLTYPRITFSWITSRQRTFRDFWQKQLLARTVKSPDGQSHLVYKKVLDEARVPTQGSGNEQAIEVAVTAEELMAPMVDSNAQSTTFHHGQSRQLWMAVLRLRHATTYETGLHEHTTNDNVEKDIAMYDVLSRLFRNIPWRTCQALRNRILLMISSRWRPSSRMIGDPIVVANGWPLLASLNERFQQPLVTMARHYAEEAQRNGWQALKEQD